MKVADQRKTWFICAFLYTVCGTVSATSVGLVLGAMGQLLGGSYSGGPWFYLIGGFGLVLAAREWRWVKFPLLEVKRQTESAWAHEFGFAMASAMWGLHIGLGFGTRVTYGGFWLLVAVALGFGSPAYGAVLLIVYWLGRALPIWVAPTFVRSVPDAMEIPRALIGDEPFFRGIAGAGLLTSATLSFFFGRQTDLSSWLDLTRLVSQ